MQAEQLTDDILLLIAHYDMIDKSLFQQKFRALEPLGKLLTDGLFDDSWGRQNR